MTASMTKRARGFRVLTTAAMAALALTFTSGCIDTNPGDGGQQEQEDGGGNQNGGGNQDGDEDGGGEDGGGGNEEDD